MKVPMSWLREYADPKATTAEIAARLSVSTCGVERIVRRGPADTSGFVVGKVLSAEKHPNADRLQLTVVDVGGKQQQIVCGAWNFGAGATVAVALPGATLPNGLTLERRELRGQMSEGMILAEDEVDLGSDHDGIMLLADELEAGTPLADVLPLVEDVLDVETTPNRPDLLSIYGLAREVAALFDVPLAPWPGVDPPRAGDETIVVDVEDFDGCPRYLARLFRDVAIGPSPVWLKARILAAGMRPISNVVDVTNYVMVALGSPLHAFDHETLQGGTVGVRRARQLIVETSGARWVGETDAHAQLPERPRVELRPARTSELVGLDVPADEQRGILRRLGFELDGDTVTVPTWRALDVTREADLIEEVARFVLDDVPFTLPARRDAIGRLTREQQLRRTVEDVLAGCGLSEAYTPSLTARDPDPDAIRLALPLSSDYSILRTTLLPTLLAAAERNRSVGNEDVALFEIARVYLPTGEQLPDEHWRIAGVVEGGYAEAKGVVDTLLAALKIEPEIERGSHPLLHPGKTAKLPQGWIGEVHPAVGRGWAAFELDLDALAAAMPGRVLYEDVITFPSVLQDLAFIVDEDVPAAVLSAAIRDAGGSEVREVSVFDEYRGEQVGAGKRSLAFRVAFGSLERTLTDEDAAAIRSRIVGVLSDRYGAELRA